MVRQIVRRLRSHAVASPSIAPTFEKLEARQLLSTSGVIAGTKVKGTNLSANGVSTNQTLITVPFTGNINIAHGSGIQLRGYAINPISGGQKKVVVGVVSATVLAADHRYLQITSDRLMRKGGTIIFAAGALKDDKGRPLAAQTVKTLKGQNKERFTLACRGFVPTDLTKFTSATFSGAPTPTPNGTPVDETTARAALSSFLSKKVTLGIITNTTMSGMLARFDNASTKSLIPDPNMRAALFSLAGTLAESAISSYLDGTNLSGKPYTIVDFSTPPDQSVPIAQTIVKSNGRLRTTVWSKFQGESFQALSVTLAHEALHQDGTVGLYEEEMANVVETLVYAQQATVDTSFLSDGSALVNRENERLYAMLESGRAIFPYVGLLKAPIRSSAGGIFVGGIVPSDGAYFSYSNFIEREYLSRGSPTISTPGNAMLNTYYKNITGNTAPSGLQFSQDLIKTIDSFQQIVTTKAAIALAGDLKLGLG